MKFISLLVLAAPLVSAFATSPARPYRARGLSLNPGPLNPPLALEELHEITEDFVTSRYPDLGPQLTNAKRLSLGMPLLPPRAIMRKSLTGYQIPSRVQHAARQGPSAVARSGTTNMQDNNGGSVGPVGRSFNVYGEYGVSSNSADPVALSFAVPNNGDSFDITASNAAVPSLPYLGGIVGFASTSSNLGPGSFNYIVLGGTAQTTLGALPAVGPNSFTAATDIPASIQSAIWGYDTTTMSVVPRWVNSDGTVPTQELVYFGDDNVVCIIGDYAAFTNAFGPATRITLALVSN